MSFIATVVVGLIIGWLASLVMKSGRGLIGVLIIGAIGGFAGIFLLQLFLGSSSMTGINITSIVTALVGVIVLLAVVQTVRR
ncbi:MAG: hypothetical protein BroJett011_74860 [Chloroflexota bacterium]|nr:MAG: hypothetical protein BroJett011_74860 [Chloroflexota bacterium]